MVKRPEQLTPAEYEIIQILWNGTSSLSVSQVLKVLRSKKSVAYTTVMTLLDKMARKGSLERVKRGKAYYYRPRVRRSGVLSFLVQEFADQYFDGEEEKLATFVQRLNSPPHDRLEEARNGSSQIEGTRKASRPSTRVRSQVRDSNGPAQEMDVCLL